MESFFLAETTKYLYLLFDPDNFIHNNGSRGTVIQTPSGECVIDAGGYFFTSEAHPIDTASVYCCSSQKKQDDKLLQNMHDNLNLLSLFDIDDGDEIKGKKLERFTRDLHSDKLGQTNGLPTDDFSSSKGFQSSVIELLSAYLKKADGADADIGLAKLGASLELLKSQVTKSEAVHSSMKDTKGVVNDGEIIVDLRKSTNLHDKVKSMEPDINLQNSKKPQSDTDIEKQKRSENLPSNDAKSELPSSTTQVAPNEAEAPPADRKYENMKSDTRTDSSSSEPLYENGADDHLSSVNSSGEINSESVNSDMKQNSKVQQTEGKPPKSVVLSVKTDNTGLASVQTSQTPQTNSKKVHHITKFNTVKKSNIFNLETIYNLLGSANEKDTVPSPNIHHLYKTINNYPLQYTSKPELMMCQSQPFHMRLSLRGEMFTVDKNK